MKYTKWVLISAMVAMMSVNAFAGVKSAEPTPPKADYINAFTLNDFGTYEYPQNTSMTANGLNKELEHVMEYAKKYDVNAIFFTARTEDGAFYRSDYFSGSMPMLFSSADPLDQLCNKANQNKIDVYASVNVFESSKSNPPLMGKLENQTFTLNGKYLINYEEEDNKERVASGLAELVKNYSLKGIVLTGFESILGDNYQSDLQEMELIIKQISERLNSYDTGISIGVSFNSDLIANNKISKMLNNLSSEGYIDFIVPVINSTTEDSSLKAILNLWDYFSKTYDVDVYPKHLANKMLSPSTNAPFYSNPHEILYQLYLNHSIPMDGAVISNYSDLDLNFLDISENIYHVSKETSLAGYENLLKKPKQSLELNVSEERILTTEDSYYIAGTSDPYRSLTVNNIPIRRVTKNGMFGVDLDLEEGTNVFTFQQNSTSQTVNIFRSTKQTDKIDKMDSNTAFPKYNEVVFGNTATLRVVAPAGARITAMIGETVYTLEPEVIKEIGSPAEFTATIKIPSTSFIKDLGNVVYSMNYKNLVTTAKSEGRLYSPAKATPVVAEVSRYFGNIYKKPSLESDMLYTLKEGTRDVILGSENDFYLLKSGGYIPKKLVTIPMVTQPLNAQYINFIDNVVMSTTDNFETFTLIGCNHAPSKMMYDEKTRSVKVEIYNARNFPVSLSHLRSTFFKDIDVEISETTVFLNFVLQDDVELWGTDISFKDGNTHIMFRTPPKINPNSLQPLKGITIFVDPSFGGDSRGMLSPIGEHASDEADLNLLNAYALMIKLRSLGASVIMSRSNDVSYATDDRLKLAENFRPDLCINLRHSVETSQEENLFLVNYTTNSSINLANKITEAIASNLRNRNTQVFYTKERMETQITYCPSVSIDLGNIKNPKEYELITDSFEIYKTASAITAAIVEIISTF